MQRVLALGAAGGANHAAEGWDDPQLSELSQDLIVDSGGGGGFPTLTRLVNPGGRIVFFGYGGKPVRRRHAKSFLETVRLQGTTMGTPEELSDMRKLFEAHRIKPLIERAYRFDEFKEAYARMRDGTQFGQLALLAPSAGT